MLCLSSAVTPSAGDEGTPNQRRAESSKGWPMALHLHGGPSCVGMKKSGGALAFSFGEALAQRVHDVDDIATRLTFSSLGLALLRRSQSLLLFRDDVEESVLDWIDRV